MKNPQDEKIKELQIRIEEKENELNNQKKRLPLTNLVLNFENKQYNLHVLKKEELISLLVRVNIHVISAKDLNILDDYQLSGYPIQHWIADIQEKLTYLKRKEEEEKLKTMKERLRLLLSDEAKLKMELDNIESFLKG